MKIIIDKFGHCIRCEKDLIVEKIIDNEVKRVTHPLYDQVQFLLDDNSKMRIVICKPCKEDYEALTEKKQAKENKKIMQSVIAGWGDEVHRIKHWHEDKKVEFIKRYRKKKIKHKIKEFKYGLNRGKT